MAEISWHRRETRRQTENTNIGLSIGSPQPTRHHFVSTSWLSDDGGQSWRKGKGQVDLPKRGAMEPEVLELVDGRLLMIMRTQPRYHRHGLLVRWR
jgi:sialidase-1